MPQSQPRRSLGWRVAQPQEEVEEGQERRQKEEEEEQEIVVRGPTARPSFLA